MPVFLPKNANTKKKMEKIFRIKRFDPEKEKEKDILAFGWEEFTVELDPFERLLDGLIKIKETQDGTLTFRRSCAHGMCGSCAMKINGRNALACQTLARNTPKTVVLEPLPAFPVIKDLVVDMDPFFENTGRVMPWLLEGGPSPEKERPQSPQELEKILDAIKCIMCGCCTGACPVYWSDKGYLGPAALVKAARFIFDSRDAGWKERLSMVSGENGLWRCHSIYNCYEVCPRSMDITGHISRLKRLAVNNIFCPRSRGKR